MQDVKREREMDGGGKEQKNGEWKKRNSRTGWINKGTGGEKRRLRKGIGRGEGERRTYSYRGTEEK